MKISPISNFGSFGHYVDDVDYNNISKEEWLEIGKLNLKGLVTVLRNVNISKDQYFQGIKLFGVIESTLRASLVKKYGHDFDALNEETYKDFSDEEKYYLRNKKYMWEKTEKGTTLTRITGIIDGQERPTGDYGRGDDLGWHSNESSYLAFAPVVSLLGYKGMIGSSTGFVQTVDYYESLSESFRSELNDMILVHKYTQGNLDPREKTETMHQVNVKMVMCPTDEAETPLVVTSPGGHKGLRYNVHTAYKIKGMTEEESAKLFAKIDKDLFTEKYIFDNWYKSDNELVLFDNSVTLHRRIGSDLNRLAYRYQYFPKNLIDSSWNPYDDPYYANEYDKIKKDIDSFTKQDNYAK